MRQMYMMYHLLVWRKSACQDLQKLTNTSSEFKFLATGWLPQYPIQDRRNTWCLAGYTFVAPSTEAGPRLLKAEFPKHSADGV